MKINLGFFAVFLIIVLLGACEEENSPADLSGVALNKLELSLTIGDSETLTAVFTPSNAANKNVTWSSSSTAVATVDVGGKVTALKTGKTTITVNTEYGGYTATCLVTVIQGVVAVTDVSLQNMTVPIGEQRSLEFGIIPANATNKNVTWQVSNPIVATVDSNGKLTTLKVGTTEVTVITVDGGKQATCRVTVEVADPNNLLSIAYIPDPLFREYCRSKMDDWDTNNDGKLYANEAAAVRSIDVANKFGTAINSLKGIEHFTGITYLDCSLNNLTTLDVSKCTRLTYLYCNNNNRLSSLILSAYTTLEILDCSACSLTSLDLSKCTRLTDLTCYFNNFESIDLSACTSLSFLDLERNELASLDLTRNRELAILICSNNQLPSLNLSNCTELTTLYCDNNNLSSLNLSNNSELIILNCDMNNITSLDVSKNLEMETLLCNNNQITSITIREDAKLSRILNANNCMDTKALNDVFSTLPPSGSIAIYNNPGASTCDRSIAENKNWTVMYQ